MISLVSFRDALLGWVVRPCLSPLCCPNLHCRPRLCARALRGLLLLHTCDTCVCRLSMTSLTSHVSSLQRLFKSGSVSRAQLNASLVNVTYLVFTLAILYTSFSAVNQVSCELLHVSSWSMPGHPFPWKSFFLFLHHSAA